MADVLRRWWLTVLCGLGAGWTAAVFALAAPDRRWGQMVVSGVGTLGWLYGAYVFRDRRREAVGEGNE